MNLTQKNQLFDNDNDSSDDNNIDDDDDDGDDDEYDSIDRRFFFFFFFFFSLTGVHFVSIGHGHVATILTCNTREASRCEGKAEPLVSPELK